MSFEDISKRIQSLEEQFTSIRISNLEKRINHLVKISCKPVKNEEITNNMIKKTKNAISKKKYHYKEKCNRRYENDEFFKSKYSCYEKYAEEETKLYLNDVLVSYINETPKEDIFQDLRNFSLNFKI